MEQRFWNILAKKLCGEADSSEQEELDMLISRNPNFADQAKAATSYAHVFDVDVSSIKVDVERAWQQVQDKKVKVIPIRSNNSSLKWIAGIAASLVLICTSVWFFINTDTHGIYHAENDSRHIILEDGTNIWLNNNTTLKIDDYFNMNSRKVILEGEAYFEVAKNAEKPFIVKANTTETKVLGTKFNIKAIGKDSLVITTLMEGKIKFSTETDQALLTPMHYAVFNLNSKKLITDSLSNKNAVAWKNSGTIEFEETQFTEVISAIESCYHVEIKVENNDILNCRFTGSFEKAKIDDLLEVIAASLNITYRIENNEVIFTGTGCNSKIDT